MREIARDVILALISFPLLFFLSAISLAADKPLLKVFHEKLPSLIDITFIMIHNIYKLWIPG